MARKPRATRKPARSATRDNAIAGSDRDKIISAFLTLLADKRLEEIGFAEIADWLPAQVSRTLTTGSLPRGRGLDAKYQASAKAYLEMIALLQKDVNQNSEECCGAGKSDKVSSPAAMSALFFTCIQKHDHKSEEHHDGAGINDHLRRRQKLRA